MKGWKRILLVFKFFMILVYIVLGVVILFSNVLLLPIHPTARTIFGIILIHAASFSLRSSLAIFLDSDSLEVVTYTSEYIKKHLYIIDL